MTSSGRKMPSPLVAGLAREVELGGEDRLVRRLHPDVDVARPPRVEPGDDRLEPVAALLVSELVAPEAEAGVVVLAPVVGLPEVEERPGDRPAVGRQDRPRERRSACRPCPGSSREARSGERGLKNGPAVWGGVGAPLSTQLGVAASVRGWATARLPARATAEGSARAAPRNSRRRGHQATITSHRAASSGPQHRCARP